MTLPNSPEALSSEGSVIMDISEADSSEAELPHVHADCIRHPRSSNLQTPYVHSQQLRMSLTVNHVSFFRGGSYTRKSKHNIGYEPEWEKEFT